jgi:hypothetical protein
LIIDNSLKRKGIPMFKILYFLETILNMNNLKR